MNDKTRVRNMLIQIFAVLLVLVLAVIGLGAWCIRMPGQSWRGELAPLDAAGETLRQRLAGHVQVLAGDIGERNSTLMRRLYLAADYVEGQFTDMGYVPSSQVYGANQYRNLSVDVYGRELRDEIIIVGAHYDTTWMTPGADDNASGVAGLLEMARALREHPSRRTVRFVAFVNEEEPFFGRDDMGSMQSARRSYERGEKIAGMYSLEMIGFYSDEPRSQYYPRVIRRFYPRVANFVGFVGNAYSRGFLHDSIAAFRRHAQFPSEGLSAPEWLVPDIRRSDNFAYWRHGYPAVMVTDTSNFRNYHYHNAGDLPKTLDYDRMARVVMGLTGMVSELANR